MDLRSGGVTEPAKPRPASAQWRVSPLLATMKVAGTLVFLLIAGYYLDQPRQAVPALVGALLLGVYAMRDLIAPVRLAADADGVTVVAGFAGRRRLSWAQIERVRVDGRERLGVRSELLEIDAGESLHLFSTYDLNAEVHEVADTLLHMRGEGAR